MINVISSEFYKIFKSRILYAISIIFLAMNVISFATSISLKLRGKMLGTGISSYQESYSVDAIFYIILIFVAYLITSEYENGSIRQMACHGIARWKLVVGQYIAISSVITIILLGFGILNLLLITKLSELGRVDAAAFIQMNVGIVCMFWGITGIGTFLSYLLKNIGITIIVSILLVASKDFIVNLFALLTKNDVFKTYTLTNMRNTIINFNSNPDNVVKYSIVLLIIGVVTILASSLLFSKRDIK
ncbi:ABC transporter permease [Clostridium tyrobutyricum]|uniref:ABC transporter permease n=1 Tax=Clostridium tyrobutyricum TaxID=1519 RepID=UPI001C38E339|nr:ABC transporter permease [Clostridium tyrobutyricum]MBV4421762.1 ABC transporter permease [Clostridium tyrobutyricum]MBV4431499.1 ABC transporter permease [Clostridium tyrobutyricum]